MIMKKVTFQTGNRIRNPGLLRAKCKMEELGKPGTKADVRWINFLIPNSTPRW